MLRGHMTIGTRGRIGAVVLLASTVCSSAAQDKRGTLTVGRESPGTIGPAKAPNQEGGRPALERRDPRYRLCESDVLELSFPFSPEFNQTVTVQPDGYITLRGVGDLHVQGQTVPQLTEVVRKAYANTLHDPVVSIDLKDFQKPYFIALGQIGHPGKFDLREDINVTEAVAIAGGFDSTAKHSQVLLFRRVSDDWVQVRKLNLKKMLRTGNLSEDIRLQSGDILYVPQNAVSKIRPWIPYPSLGLYLPQP
jgi:polysaccharide biosynthesis/export protein